MDKTTHEVRQARWAALIQECNNSGMSKKAWLKEHHVNEKQFYYWQRRIRAAAAREMQDTLFCRLYGNLTSTGISGNSCGRGFPCKQGGCRSAGRKHDIGSV